MGGPRCQAPEETRPRLHFDYRSSDMHARKTPTGTPTALSGYFAWTATHAFATSHGHCSGSGHQSLRGLKIAVAGSSAEKTNSLVHACRFGDEGFGYDSPGTNPLEGQNPTPGTGTPRTFRGATLRPPGATEQEDGLPWEAAAGDALGLHASPLPSRRRQRRLASLDRKEYSGHGWEDALPIGNCAVSDLCLDGSGR
jgi:hypothetical protein